MTQTVSFEYEALFLLVAALSCSALVAVGILLFRRRFAAAKRLLAALAFTSGTYLSIVFLVAATAHQQILPRNHELCFDDMCFAVAHVETTKQIGTAIANGVFYVVTVRVANHARRRAQRELGLRALLWSDGKQYETSSRAQSAWAEGHPESFPLTSKIQPGQSILSDQVFEIPASATGPGLFFSQGFTPGYFVIGECPLFHKPTVLQLAP
jgi:hypothetical protein